MDKLNVGSIFSSLDGIGGDSSSSTGQGSDLVSEIISYLQMQAGSGASGLTGSSGASSAASGASSGSSSSSSASAANSNGCGMGAGSIKMV